MSRDVVLRIQYNAESVLIFEVERGIKYEVARFTKDDMDATAGLPETIDQFRELAETNPSMLIAKLHGSVEAWDAMKSEREIGPVNR